MIRPYSAWCGVVVGLGILAGCSKKTAPTGSADTLPAPAPKVVAKVDNVPAKKVQPEQPVTLENSSPKSDIDKPAETPVQSKMAEVALPSNPPFETGVSSGSVEVSQCKFDGVEKAIAKAKGKVVLIDCWATWCGPCVASFPKLVEKHQKYAGKGLAVISLSTDKPTDSSKVIAFLKKNNATFTNLQMPLDGAAQKGLVEKFAFRNAIPHAVLFNKTGKRVWAGHPMDPELVSLIEKELAKDVPAS